jgi:PAS domain S-box-containing protein
MLLFIYATAMSLLMEKQIHNAEEEILKLKLEIKESGDKHRSFFDSSSVIHLFIDTNKTLLDFNRAAQHFVKKYYGLEIVEGTEISSFMHDEHFAGFDRSYETALAGTPVRTEKMLTYSGEEIHWFLSYEPAWDSEGKILGVSYNAVDISEKVANEYKILEQYNSLKEIAYIQSHEFRKPVMNIIGLINIFAAEDYNSTREELIMLEHAVRELEKLMLKIEQQSS